MAVRIIAKNHIKNEYMPTETMTDTRNGGKKQDVTPMKHIILNWIVVYRLDLEKLVVQKKYEHAGYRTCQWPTDYTHTNPTYARYRANKTNLVVSKAKNRVPYLKHRKTALLKVFFTL